MSRSSMLFFFALTSLILGPGCSSDPLKDKVVEFDKFQKEYQVKAEPVEWLDIWNYHGLRIYDTILVAVDWGQDKLFRVYSLNSHKLIGAFGSRGKGPGEFIRPPELTSVFSFVDQVLIIQCYDYERRTIQNINLSQSINAGKVVEHNRYVLPEYYLGSSPLLTDDSKLINADSSVLQVYDPEKNEWIKSHKPINTKQDLPQMFARIARIMYIEKAPHLDRIVGSFNVQKRLHIYNTKGELLKVIKEKGDPIFDISGKEFYGRNKVHFSKTFLSDKYFLVLDENRFDRDTGGELLLFDYEANALKKYKLDCYAYQGAVDWKEKRLYTCNIREGTMISFLLPDLDN